MIWQQKYGCWLKVLYGEKYTDGKNTNEKLLMPQKP
jgi:hypothetical protein